MSEHLDREAQLIHDIGVLRKTVARQGTELSQSRSEALELNRQLAAIRYGLTELRDLAVAASEALPGRPTRAVRVRTAQAALDIHHNVTGVTHG